MRNLNQNRIGKTFSLLAAAAGLHDVVAVLGVGLEGELRATRLAESVEPVHRNVQIPCRNTQKTQLNSILLNLFAAFLLNANAEWYVSSCTFSILELNLVPMYMNSPHVLPADP